MTEREIYDGVVVNGTTDFFCVVETLQRCGARWCVLGGWAINTYATPVYTAILRLAVAADDLQRVTRSLLAADFRVKERSSSVLARRSPTQDNSRAHRLTAHFISTDQHRSFVERAGLRTVFGVDVPVAAVADVVQDKLWTWNDPARRASQHIEDEMDLLRLAETYFDEVGPRLPDQLRAIAQEDRKRRSEGVEDGWGND